MSNSMKYTAALVIGAAALCASAAASAQTAGSWLVSVGYNDIKPQGTSDPLSAPSIPNSTTKVASDSQPILNIGYMFTDHISAELGLGTPYTHKLSGAGALQGAGNLGSLQQLPPTLFGQYRFLEANSPFRPYVGVGLTYAYFRDEKGSGTLTAISNPGGPATTFTVDNAWGVTPEVGLTFAINDKWFAGAMITKTFIKTTVHLSTGQSADAPLNPIATALYVGYRF